MKWRQGKVTQYINRRDVNGPQSDKLHQDFSID